jgi:hypothetical protein
MSRSFLVLSAAFVLFTPTESTLVSACGCSAAPEPVDVMVLAGLLVLRTLSERMLTGRH